MLSADAQTTMNDYPPSSTAAKILAVLHDHGLRFEGKRRKPIDEATGEVIEVQHFRSNRPWSPNPDPDSLGLEIRIEDVIGEEGGYSDYVESTTGSLYALAVRMGVQPPESADTMVVYTSLADYAERHGLTEQDLLDWRYSWGTAWSNGEERPAIRFETQTGTRWRFADGHKPKFGHKRQYDRCWYGLKKAVRMAQAQDCPLVLCNGEVSTVAGQVHMVPATTVTSGEKGTYPPELIAELQKVWPGGELWVALDCDSSGRMKAPRLAAQLRMSGFTVTVLDLGGENGFDLADFCALHGTASLAVLRGISERVRLAPPPALLPEGSAVSATASEYTVLATLAEDLLAWGRLPVGFGPDFFGGRDTRDVFSALQHLYKAGSRGELGLVVETLRKAGTLAAIGGADRVHQILSTPSTTAEGIKHYCAHLEDAAVRRAVLSESLKIQAMVRDPAVTLDDLKNQAQAGMRVAIGSGRKEALVPIQAGADMLYNRLMGNAVPTIKTGIQSFDALTGGIVLGSCNLITGRPSTGKSALCYTMAYHIASQGTPVLVFTLELHLEEVTARLTSCAMASPDFGGQHGIRPVAYSDMRIGRIDHERELPDIVRTLAHVQGLPIYAMTASISAADIRSQVQDFVLQTGERPVVMIDYLQLMPMPGKVSNRAEGVGANAYEIKLKIANDTSLTQGVVLVAQLNREIEKSKDGPPMLSYLEDSGKIEQAVDTALFLVGHENLSADDRASALHLPQNSDASMIRGFLLKNRNGPKGTYDLVYRKPFNWFGDVSRRTP